MLVQDVTRVREFERKSLDGSLSETDAEVLLCDMELVQAYGQSGRVDWFFFGEAREPNVFAETEREDQAERVHLRRPRVYREDADGLCYCWPSPPFEPLIVMSLAREPDDCRAMNCKRECQFVQLLRATRSQKARARGPNGFSAFKIKPRIPLSLSLSASHSPSLNSSLQPSLQFAYSRV